MERQRADPALVGRARVGEKGVLGMMNSSRKRDHRGEARGTCVVP